MTTSFAPHDAIDNPPTAVLLNMGGRPSSSVTLAGLHGCDLRRISLACFTEKICNPAHAWCQLLGLPCENEVHGLAQLRRAMQHKPPSLAALPPMASVVQSPKVASQHHASFSTDPQLVLSVLCRCSCAVFVRDRSPLVTLANLSRDLALVLPLSTKELSQ